MKLIVKKHGENVKAVNVEYTPVEWIVARHAMRRFCKDEEVDIVDKLIMKDMISALPDEWRSMAIGRTRTIFSRLVYPMRNFGILRLIIFSVKIGMLSTRWDMTRLTRKHYLRF